MVDLYSIWNWLSGEHILHPHDRRWMIIFSEATKRRAVLLYAINDRQRYTFHLSGKDGGKLFSSEWLLWIFEAEGWSFDSEGNNNSKVINCFLLSCRPGTFDEMSAMINLYRLHSLSIAEPSKCSHCHVLLLLQRFRLNSLALVHSTPAHAVSVMITDCQEQQHCHWEKGMHCWIEMYHKPYRTIQFPLRDCSPLRPTWVNNDGNNDLCIVHFHWPLSMLLGERWEDSGTDAKPFCFIWLRFDSDSR